MKSQKPIFFSALVFSVFLITGCGIFRKMVNFSKCTFYYHSVENVNLAGVSFKDKKSFSDFSIIDLGKLSAALISRKMDVTMDVNIEAVNPNAKPAGISRLEWKLFLDDVEILSGYTEDKIEIPGSGSQVFPVHIKFDILQYCHDKESKAVANLVLNLMDMGEEESRLKIKLKPSVHVAGVRLAYPGYITIHRSL